MPWDVSSWAFGLLPAVKITNKAGNLDLNSLEVDPVRAGKLEVREGRGFGLGDEQGPWRRALLG